MRIGKERCERKAYPDRVYSDRNRIRLRVNRALDKERTFPCDQGSNETELHVTFENKLIEWI